MRELVLPGYDVLEQLGVGGFGEVRLARHRALGRLVAVKRLRSFARDDDGAAERFRREARVLAMLDCPQIVGVYDYRVTRGGAEDGEALLVMEYVPGRPLDDLLAERGLSRRQLLRVLSDVAAALDGAARQGVVHRDIKPANVFVLPDGTAKLGDFGLARITGDSAAFRTAAGLVSGTPAYLAPEVAAGSDPDLRSDAYSFAVLAYECLVGRLPFDARSIYALMAAHADSAPPRPSELVDGFPAEAQQALLVGLAKEPAARPLPAQLAAALRSAPGWPGPEPGWGTGPEPIQPGSAPRHRPAVQSSPRLARHHRRWPVLVAGIAAAVVAAAAVTVVALRSDGQPARPVVEQVTVSTPGSPALRCPSASAEFVAQIATKGPGARLLLHWTQPNGQAAPPASLDVPMGTRRSQAVLRFDIAGDTPLTGAARLDVIDAGTGRQLGTASSPPVVYRCP